MNIKTPYFSFFHHREQKKNRQSFLLMIILLLAACSVSPIATQQRSNSKTDAVIVSQDETIAASGQKMIQNGGNAADAMAAMLITGSVVLPSRMGLGSGGVCQILDPTVGRVKTLGFLSTPMTFDRKTGTPSLARGVYTLQNKYGVKPWKEIFTDGIALAEKGISVSSILSKDIVHTKGLPAKWKNLKKKDTLTQPELAKTLRTLSKEGAGALYNVDLGENGLASSIVSQSDQIIQEDLKATQTSVMDSIDVTTNTGKTFFPNPTILSSDGYMIWKNLQNPSKTDKIKEAQEKIKEISTKTVKAEDSVSGMSLIAADKSGLVIACSVSMGAPFGTRDLMKEGFYLSKPIHSKDRGYVFLNALQTNPDVTDVTYSLQGVGDYALSDGLDLMSKEQLKNNSDAVNNQTVLSELSCEKGYPNDVSSCKENSTLYKILKKQDLTN